MVSEKDICALDVAMQNSYAVQVLQRKQHLTQYVRDVLFLHLLATLLQQVRDRSSSCILHDDIQLLATWDTTIVADAIWMTNALHYLNFIFNDVRIVLQEEKQKEGTEKQV